MDEHQHHRRSIRLKDYDYTTPGAYFITICTYRREHILWENREGHILLSQFGLIARNCWLEMSVRYPNLRLDEFCIMPDHIHGIIQLTGDDPKNRLSEIMRRFKSDSARRINVARHTTGIPVWQRNYYEHIIRNEKEWAQVREYISLNPQNWKDDQNTGSSIFP